MNEEIEAALRVIQEDRETHGSITDDEDQQRQLEIALETIYKAKER